MLYITICNACMIISQIPSQYELVLFTGNSVKSMT